MHTLIPLNWSANKLTKQSITKMICNYKFHLIAEMMQFISELYGWDHQHHNQQELFLTLVQNTLLLLQFFATMKLQEIISLKSMILFKAGSSKEIRCIEDVKLWPMTCTSLIPTKSCQRLVPNWHMVPPSFKVSSGKTTPVYRPLRVVHNQVSNWNLNWNKTNVPSSNFWLCISHKVLAMILMVFLDFHHIKTWKRRSFITCGHLKIMELLIEPWLVSALHPKKWVKHHMLFSEDTIQPKL